MEDSRVLEYGNVAFSCIHKENSREEFSLRDHALIYLSGGKLEIIGPEGVSVLSQGDCAFVRKDCRVTLAKSREKDGAPYKAVTMRFTREYLLRYYRSLRGVPVPVWARRGEDPVVTIPSRPDVSALFQSLMPFFWSDENPDRTWLELKMAEGLMCILRTDPNLYASLFDFTSRWKIDLVGFMEENYMAEMSLSDYAHYTGRSLSTFNRDFREAYGIPPRKWLVRKRLDLAREILRGRGCEVQEAMADAGFGNLSSFSRAYKSAFGHPPSKEEVLDRLDEDVDHLDVDLLDTVRVGSVGSHD